MARTQGTRRAIASRTLVALIGATIALSALAVYGLRSRTNTLRGSDASGLVFPNLRDSLNSIVRVEVDTGSTPLILERTADGSWAVASLANYPAEAETVKALLMGLASLEYDEQLTANPNKHGALGLRYPATADNGSGASQQNEQREQNGQNANGTRVRTFASIDGGAPAAEPCAAIILGSSTFQPPRQSIRLDNDTQAWRVTGNASASDAVMSWVKRDVVQVPVEQLQAVSFEGLEVKRPSPNAGASAVTPPDATLGTPTVDWELAFTGPVAWTPEEANRAKGPLTNFLTRLECDDLRPIPADNAACDGQVIHYTLDGGSLDLTLSEHDGRLWARLSGEAAPANAGGFEFRLPEWKVNQIKNLLPKPPASAPPAVPAPTDPAALSPESQ